MPRYKNIWCVIPTNRNLALAKTAISCALIRTRWLRGWRLPLSQPVPRSAITTCAANSWTSRTNGLKQRSMRRMPLVCWVRISKVQVSTLIYIRHWALGLTSAARKRPCWNRWRVKKASRVTSRRFLPVTASMVGRPPSTIQRPIPRSLRSSATVASGSRR